MAKAFVVRQSDPFTQVTLTLTMSLTLKLDLDMVMMSHHTKNEVFYVKAFKSYSPNRLTYTQTDTQTIRKHYLSA